MHQYQLLIKKIIQRKKNVSGQGIYFLTDGQPQPGGVITGEDGKSGTAYSLMKTDIRF